MILIYLILKLSLQQELGLAVSDLKDPSIIDEVDGWTVSNNGVVQQYQTTIGKCNQNLLLLNRQPNIYKKIFTITDKEYDQLYLEMDLYFINFSSSKLKIYVNSNLVFKQKFSTNYMKQNDICGNSDSQYTIYQSFISQQTTLNLEIQFIATSVNSQLGIKNFNIYTNGYKLSNGCSLDLPFLQGTQCVQYCSNNNAYLGGEDMLVCQSGMTGQSSLIGQYLVSGTFVWKFNNLSPSLQEQYYLTPNDFFLQIDNTYNPIHYNIMYSGLFTSSFIFTSQYYYYITQSIQSTYKLQITFIFYILGDWDDGSQVSLYIKGDGIYRNHMVRISKKMGKYSSSTGSGIYYTKIASTAGTIITVRRTLITFQADFYSSTVNIGFSQQLSGNTAKYGFGNVYIYELQNDPNIVLSGLYGLPYQCIANYYAYNGYCTQNCPAYAFKDSVNNNCTDITQQQSKIFSNTQTQNYYGTYIVKEFYNNNFNWDNVNNLFKVILNPYNNYLNGQPFSFIGNKKILGGYSSWGWGTYLALINLPLHNQIRIQFNLYLIDNWQAGDTLNYYLDGFQESSYSQNSPNIQLQGLSHLDQHIFVDQKFIHAQSTLTLMFICNILQKNSMAASCGISDLYVLIDKKTDDTLCPSITQYFSYFTNICENCILSGCQLYPDYLPVPQIKCSNGCLSCESSTVCSQCDADSGYQKTGEICSCLSGYVLQTTCNKCHYSCLACTGRSSSQCSQCVGTRTLQAGVCQCQAGSIDVFSQSQCVQIYDQTSTYCHYSCETCFSTQYYHCVTCPVGSNRTYNDWSSCPCNAQYIDVGVKNCALIPCDDTCLACNGPLESNCLSCKSNFRFESGFCICDGLYNNISQSDACVLNSSQCDASCLTCLDQTPIGCLSCDPSKHRFLDFDQATNQQQCKCFDGYFEAQQNCQICDQTCLTCSSSAISCNTCDSEQFREISNSNTCACMVGYNERLNPGQPCVLNLTNCHYSCSICYGSLPDQCIACNSTYRIFNNTTCDCLTSQYDAGQLQCQNCYPTCLTCNGILINNCLTCNTSLNRILYSNQCICITGYNDKLDADSCQEDMHTCAQTCLSCFGMGQSQCLSCPSDRTLQGTSCICKSIYYEQSSICHLCDQTCLTCSDSGPNNCINCDNQNFRQKIINSCICMSGYVDIGNPVCQVCPNDCKECDSQFKCIVCKIQNSIVNNTNGRCDCIDGYLLRDVQCLKCHYSCQNCNGLFNSQCTQCDPSQFRKLQVNVCQCLDGYQENEIGQCVDCQSDQGKLLFSCQYKNAQDGVWTFGEQCDDANNDSRDGCDNFQITNNYSCTNIFNQPSICYKCPDNCLKCQLQEDLQKQEQIICLQCDSKYYNAESECVPCYEDSCVECPSPSNCSVCFNQEIPILGKCNTCQYGYYYDENQCKSKCGDGIKTIDEQCDDGNIQSSDGCSDLCLIENDFICKSINNNSNCFMHQQPYLIYEVPYQQVSEQKIILISVSQNVQYRDLQIQLLEYPNIEKQFVVSGNDSLIIDLKLTFNQSYESITFNLLVNGMIVNQYNQGLKDNKIQITLRDIIVLNDQQKQTAQQLSSVGQGVVIGLFCMSTTTIFMVGISQFISFSNLVRQLQFIQYINIEFPPNFMQFLNIFNGFTVAPLFETFSIQQKLTRLDPYQQVFLSYGMNAYYLANMQGFFFSSIILFIFYHWLKLVIYVVQYIKEYMFNREIIKLNIYIYLKTFQLLLQKTSHLIKTEGFNQLVLTTCYDIQFGIFLQLNNQYYDNFDLVLNNFLAILNQIIYLKFMGNKIKNSEIFNGRWQQLYQQVKLMAALLFTFAIVQLQNFPQSQLFIISSTSLISSIYMFVVQPFKKVLRNYQLVIQEMALCISSLTFVAYIYFPQSVDPIVLGWFHIMTFISMLLGNLVIDLYQFVVNIKKVYFI